MGFLDEIAEQLMEHMDLKAITQEVLSKLIITELDMYFVVEKFPDSETYEFVGMTYDRATARELKHQRHWADSPSIHCKILKFDMGKLAVLVEQMGAAEEVT